MIKNTVIIICIIVPAISIAKDLGKVANTFAILEEPFTEMIKRRLEKVDIEQERQKMESIARDRVENPKPIEGIREAQEDRVFYYDPTYILQEDAVLPCGKILYAAGTKVNPLEHMDLDRRLFFIDSRNQNQVKWLKAQLEEKVVAAIEDRIIIVGGSVFKLKEELGPEHEDKVYFDQEGELVHKFGINASPAIAMQEGNRLKIEEIWVKND
jgi:conjugal transfer pilus assembly protein TraW